MTAWPFGGHGALEEARNTSGFTREHRKESRIKVSQVSETEAQQAK